MKRVILTLTASFILSSLMFGQAQIQAKRLIDFHQGYASIKTSKGWRIIDTLGNLLTKTYFISAPGPFSEGLAVVHVKEHSYGYLDTRGEMVLDPIYERTYPFHDGIAIVKLKFGEYNTEYTNGYCAIDTKGTIVKRYGKVWVESDIKDGLILIKKDDLYGFMDIDGRMVIFPRFSVLRHFHSGRAYALKKSKWGDTEGYINRKGEFVIVKE